MSTGGLRLRKLDRVFVLWLFSASFFWVLSEGPSAIVYRRGVSSDVFTGFFLIRMLIRTRDQALIFWRQLAWMVLLLALFMLHEAVTRYNVFGLFTYARFDPIEIREGKARVQGPWSNGSLAGTFGSALLPVFIGTYRGRK